MNSSFMTYREENEKLRDALEAAEKRVAELTEQVKVAREGLLAAHRRLMHSHPCPCRICAALSKLQGAE